jgi:ubiquinone/menaquinone biosynthesis C-methylase UbiE
VRQLRAEERAGYTSVGVADGYDRWAPSYDGDPNPLIVVEEPVVLELIGEAHGLQVLDLGCGTGRYAGLLARRGAVVTGIDLSPGMLRQALQRQSITTFHPILGKLSSLCLPADRFDLILCALTLSHVRHLEPVFAEATRVLKPGGSIVISDFHPYWAVFGHDYTEFFDETGQEYRIPCYAHRFEEYWRLFQRYGWQLDILQEPEIDDELITQFPALAGYRRIPLALVMRLCFRDS